jgi:hypothetical protein
VPAPFHFDRRWQFPVSPERFWDTVNRTEQYHEWWSWLREFDADGLHEGASAHCVIQAPLPYSLRLDLHIERMVPAELVAVRVAGDLEGPARLEVRPGPGGCEARLVWTLDVHEPWLRRLALVGRPVMGWAHDRVVEVGAREFRRRALGDQD